MIHRFGPALAAGLLLFSSFAAAEDFSPAQHDAARRLLEITIPLKNTEITQTVIEQITASRPELAGKEDAMRAMIDDFLSSPDYLETGTRAVMYFFSEAELKDMVASLERGQGSGSDAQRMALLKKYDKLLGKVEEMLADYFAGKLKHWNPIPTAEDSLP